MIFRVIKGYSMSDNTEEKKPKQSTGKVSKLAIILTVFCVYYLSIWFLSDRIAGESAAQFLENLTVYLREHDRRVNLTTLQSWQLFQGTTTTLVAL